MLGEWWRRSIDEGLRLHPPSTGLEYDFELVYWASLLHSEPLDPATMDEPYLEAREAPAAKSAETRVERQRRQAVERAAHAIDRVRDRFEILGDLGDLVDRIPWTLIEQVFGEEVDDRVKQVLSGAPVSAAIIEVAFGDLHTYYTDTELRDRIQNKLAAVLLRDDVRDRKLMLVAHSMGSIVAFDVLKKFELSEPDVKVDCLVTIGSPLGLGYVRDRNVDLLESQRYQGIAASAPTTVSRWVNHADSGDKVAAIPLLAGYYAANADGTSCEDRLVNNAYVGRTRRNQHKSYGYLRTPEFTKLLRDFSMG